MRMRLKEVAAAKPPKVARASSLRLPAMLRIALQTGIPRSSSTVFPVGSDSRCKLEARATLLRSSGFAYLLAFTASTFNHTLTAPPLESGLSNPVLASWLIVFITRHDESYFLHAICYCRYFHQLRLRAASEGGIAATLPKRRSWSWPRCQSTRRRKGARQCPR